MADLSSLRIGFLADHPESLPVLKNLFETEWAGYYGPDGPGDAEADLQAYAGRDSLPVGLVAFLGGEVCGIVALKQESITTHKHLSPWAAAGLVAPQFRRLGIGGHLIDALEEAARGLGYSILYCGTSTAASLLDRLGWQWMERTEYCGEDLSVYQKIL